MKRLLVITSLLSCLMLIAAQVGTALEFAFVPPPTAATTGPQNTLDLVAGLTAGLGGVLGLLLAVLAGVLGLVVAVQRRQSGWLWAIAVAGGLVVVGLGLAAFLLVGVGRNPFHPLVLAILVPVTTLGYGVTGSGAAQHARART
jgi:hypothetical protein